MEKFSLEKEIVREIANVGGSYGLKIENYMKEMERLRKALFYLKLRIRRSGKIPMFSMKLAISLRKKFFIIRERAYEQRKLLIIYREALGLTNHRDVFEVYNIEKFDRDII